MTMCINVYTSVTSDLQDPLLKAARWVLNATELHDFGVVVQDILAATLVAAMHLPSAHLSVHLPSKILKAVGGELTYAGKTSYHFQVG